MTLDITCSQFAALSDPTRLRLMALLQREGALCVCEMTHALGIPQPKASKHLATLREAGLVRMRRDAQWVLYAIAAEPGDGLAAVLSATFGNLEHDPELVADRERLAGMIDRPERHRVA